MKALVSKAIKWCVAQRSPFHPPIFSYFIHKWQVHLPYCFPNLQFPHLFLVSHTPYMLFGTWSTKLGTLSSTLGIWSFVSNTWYLVSNTWSGNMPEHCTVGSLLCILAYMGYNFYILVHTFTYLFILEGTFTYLEVLVQQLIWETTGCGLCHRTSFLNPLQTLKPSRGTNSQYKRMNRAALQKTVKITIVYENQKLLSGKYLFWRKQRHNSWIVFV